MCSSFAEYDDSLEQEGWDRLTLTLNPMAKDWKDQIGGIGYLEGTLVQKRIWNHRKNLWAWYLKDYFKTDKMPQAVFDYIGDNLAWMRQMIKQHAASDDYWANTEMLLHQADAILLGYNSVASKDEKLTEGDWYMYLAAGDMLDIANIVNVGFDWHNPNHTMNEIVDRYIKDSHCSGLVAFTPDYEDLYMGHTSWFFFGSQTRCLKKYDLKGIKSTHMHIKDVTFSSYPGFLNSFDDFYVTGANLVVLETTNEIFDHDVYDSAKPQSMFVWARAVIANRVSNDGQTWVNTFKRFNSGTYNNQWLVLDYKKFTPGKEPEDDSGLLYALEQIPGGKYISSSFTQAMPMLTSPTPSRSSPTSPATTSLCSRRSSTSLATPLWSRRSVTRGPTRSAPAPTSSAVMPPRLSTPVTSAVFSARTTGSTTSSASATRALTLLPVTTCARRTPCPSVPSTPSSPTPSCRPRATSSPSRRPRMTSRSPGPSTTPPSGAPTRALRRVPTTTSGSRGPLVSSKEINDVVVGWVGHVAFCKQYDKIDMVKIHFKKDEKHQFLIETTNQQSVDDLTDQLCEMNNKCVVLEHLADNIAEFAKYGVARIMEDRGLDVPANQEVHQSFPGTIWREDPSRLRLGYAPGEDMQKRIEATVAEVKAAIHYGNADLRKLLTREMLTECREKLDGIVKIACASHYPSYATTGLPEYDDIAMTLTMEPSDALADKQAVKMLLDPEKTDLWFAQKRMEKGQSKKLVDYLGRNEKMKVVVKPSTAGRPPVQEQQSELQRKEMMSFYYKKQQEFERMEDEDGVDGVNALWAKSGGLKRQMQGMGDLKWR